LIGGGVEFTYIAAMVFDIRTATVLMSIISIVMAICIGLAQRYYEDDLGKPLRMWARGTLLTGCAIFLFSLRGEIPDWVSVVVGNIFYMFGQGDVLRSLWQFGGRKDRLALAYVTAIIVPCLVYYAHWHMHDLSFRIQLFSLGAACLSIMQFHAALQIKPERAKTGQRIIASVTVLAGILLLARALSMVGTHDRVENLFVASNVQIAVVAFGVVAQSIETIGFVLMCNDRLVERLAALARIDPLTGLANRRAAIESIEAWIADEKNPSAIGVMLIDADHFKQINDTFGHATGDIALQNIANAIVERVPGNSVLARWGGEEFLVALRGQTPIEVSKTAEILRDSITKLNQSSVEKMPQLAVSIGCANTVVNAQTKMERLVNQADEALYRAKREGRNRVAVAEFLG
jgi:diguanylate cyclase (GGDEF)-like protein